MKKTFFVSTPIYYTSGRLTIGHSYTTITCDVIARYKRMRNYDVFFVTGTDEHGQKVQEKAHELGLTPKKYADDLVENCKDLWRLLKIDYDYFIRTTDENHVQSVQKIFSTFIKNDDIYKSKYQGWYCTPCESFWTDTQIGENKLCPDCGRPVHLEQEESYFFKMSKYVDQLLEHYDKHPDFIEPIARRNELVNNFIKPGLEDLCVSRTSFSWGVPVLEDPRHVVYVWIDALSNYINALGYNSSDESLFKKFWHNDENHEILHVVGKEITRFHCIYWPIMLLALGLDLPSKIYGHGWIMMKDGRMAKSKGNVVYPEDLISRYGLDSLRYFSVNCIVFGDDGLFTPELFINNFNNDLVNNYGNLVNRSVAMINKYCAGLTPKYAGPITEFDQKLEEACQKAKKNYEYYMDKFYITDAIKEAFELLSKGNKYIDETQPWVLAKDLSKKAELDSVLVHLALLIKEATIMLSPILVEATPKVFNFLGVEDTSYDSMLDYQTVANKMVNKTSVLFPRLDPKIESEYIQSKMKG
ncbi:MAG: methionine--tRNA ligase [Bacilli bacterium]|jgi:methionyl-tRNA synthetase